MSATLQAALDSVVVGHLDGHGRTVLWRTPGARDVAAAVRQAAVVPGRFDREPGWILRELPDGRLLFLAGGTQHPKLVDALGRGGIFHGAGFIGSARDVGTALCAPDAARLCMELARVRMRGFGTVASLRPAVEESARRGPLPWAPGQDALRATDWPSARDALRAGLRPFAGPIGGMLVPGQDALPAGPLPALRLDGAQDAAKRIIDTWLA